VRLGRTRLRAIAGAAVTSCLVAAAPAAADHHLTKVNEVFPGTPSAPDKAFIELKMTADGQNLMSGHPVVVYGPTGVVEDSFVIPGNVALGQSQRTVLVGDIDVTNRDFLNNALGTNIAYAGGAVCFTDAIPPDCVAWGSFSAPGVLPAPVGAPVAPGGIPGAGTNASSIVRTAIGAGCATALDEADDRNDSATEFSVTDAESPENNAKQPVETVCAPPPCGGKAVTTSGTPGADKLKGTKGADVIAGLGGRDRISGLGGNDVICGGPGKDTLLGGPGKDRLLGQAGADVLRGGPGKDRLKGGAGRDKQLQ
jgi:hypothetical protein